MDREKMETFLNFSFFFFLKTDSNGCYKVICQVQINIKATIIVIEPCTRKEYKKGKPEQKKKKKRKKLQLIAVEI